MSENDKSQSEKYRKQIKKKKKKDISHTGLGSNPVTSVNLNYVSKDLLSKQIHVRKYYGLELQHMNFKMSEFSPLHSDSEERELLNLLETTLRGE